MDWEFSGNLTLKTRMTWLSDFQWTGGNRDSNLGGHKQNLVHMKTHGKGEVTPQDAGSDPLACVSGSSVEVFWQWLTSEMGHWQPKPWEEFLGVSPHVLSSPVVSNSWRPCGLQPARLLCPWGFARQKHWSGLPCPPPGNLPDPGIEPGSPTLQADSLPSEPLGSGEKSPYHHSAWRPQLWGYLRPNNKQGGSPTPPISGKLG